MTSTLLEAAVGLYALPYRVLLRGANHAVVLLMFGTLCVACGDDRAPSRSAAPAWARVAPEQVAEAERRGVPVAFENELGMRFVLVPAGTFWMGSSEESLRTGELLCPRETNDERPRHQVTFTSAFYISIYETTNAQYRRMHPHHRGGTWQGHSLSADQHPVVEVSHREATAFASWLSEKDGQCTYALPTEAQWEYACRAGRESRFSFGDEVEDFTKVANLWDPPLPGPGRGAAADTIWRATVRVGRYAPNPWGLYDMHGNVAEWCADWYGVPYPAGAVVDPDGPRSGEDRVIRGGSWEDVPRYARCASRSWSPEDWRANTVGFRLVCTRPRRFR